MTFFPPSSMPVPTWFLRQTATITVMLATQETSGAWEQSASVTYTAACNLQPASSGDAAVYKRETGRTLYRLFLGPTTTNGTAIGTVINKVGTITIDGVVYQTDGELLDLCSNGVCFQLNVFRET